jgi:WhiB family redox-sensing transcriptional regulator
MTANIIELPGRLKAPGSIASTRGLPCQQEDSALWFSSLPAELNLAKAYCGGCHNRGPCLAGALERSEPTGVWGGEIFENGRLIESKRPRGRPRKASPGVAQGCIPPESESLADTRQSVESNRTAEVSFRLRTVVTTEEREERCLRPGLIRR